MPQISFIELFAGVGGFRLGLETASRRFRSVWANQWEPGTKAQHAFDCYVKHFGPSEGHVNNDIRLSHHRIPPHDLLVGGFPCQDYSVARTNAAGIEGKKGVLWWEINQIIEAQRPSYILLENVDRLLKSPARQHGRDFGSILRCLNDSGYSAEWRVINASDYGFAQKRRRVFIFAFHRSTPFHNKLSASSFSPEKWLSANGFFASPFPICPVVGKISGTSLKSFKNLAEICNEFIFEFANTGVLREGAIFSLKTTPPPCISTTLGEFLEKEVVNERFYVTSNIEKWRYMKGAKKEPRVRPNGESYFYSEGAIPFPDRLDAPARTILTSESSTTRSTHLVMDPITHRYRLLVPEECEKLNGFPPGWTDTGMPERARYFMMGNALIVPLIIRMGRRLCELIPED